MNTVDSDNEQIKQIELYRIALETRNFEISMFWRRANYFLLANSAIGIGFFSLIGAAKAFSIVQVALAALGGIVSFLWLNVNLGSKFWQSRWEKRLQELEAEYDVRIKFFNAPWDDVKAAVEQSLCESNHHHVQKFIDRFVVNKPSVTSMVIYLSVIFIIFWVLLFIVSAVSAILSI